MKSNVANGCILRTEQALRNYEDSYGPQHVLALDLLVQLSRLYAANGNGDRAKSTLKRAVRGLKETRGCHDVLTRNAVDALAECNAASESLVAGSVTADNQTRLKEQEAFY